MDLIYDYIEMTLRRDLSQAERYRINLDDFYTLWQTAYDEKKQEDQQLFKQRENRSERSTTLDNYSSRISDYNMKKKNSTGVGGLCICSQRRDKSEIFASFDDMDAVVKERKALRPPKLASDESKEEVDITQRSAKTTLERGLTPSSDSEEQQINKNNESSKSTRSEAVVLHVQRKKSSIPL
ncbi:hypothetical protein FGO68_gene2526 [Halteria grandinella]|uniref:Uncharacterized protein n=1 Tax=Halteria grandinella TaxID=5974 RepID=A0A8J8P7I0_HALGN|nr:hypothetical protein FGO68_gene2526 [Halteria grandinella]